MCECVYVCVYVCWMNESAQHWTGLILFDRILYLGGDRNQIWQDKDTSVK